MEHKDEIPLFEFECDNGPAPEGTAAPPRPRHRPRRITREILPEATIGPELERFVLAALDDAAVQKVAEDRKADVGFGDACRFWGLTEHMRKNQIEEQLSKRVNQLRELNRACTETCTLPRSGRILTPADVRLLWSTFFFLEERFQRHLDVLRGRGNGQ